MKRWTWFPGIRVFRVTGGALHEEKVADSSITVPADLKGFEKREYKT